MTSPAFSRTGQPSLGKCTDDLKTTVPEVAKQAFSAIAFNRKMVPGTLLHDLVMEFLFGNAQGHMREIAWAHVCQETESEYIREVMHTFIFGLVDQSHVANINQSHDNASATIGRHYDQQSGR